MQLHQSDIWSLHHHMISKKDPPPFCTFRDTAIIKILSIQTVSSLKLFETGLIRFQSVFTSAHGNEID